MSLSCFVFGRELNLAGRISGLRGIYRRSPVIRPGRIWGGLLPAWSWGGVPARVRAWGLACLGPRLFVSWGAGGRVPGVRLVAQFPLPFPRCLVAWLVVFGGAWPPLPRSRACLRIKMWQSSRLPDVGLMWLPIISITFVTRPKEEAAMGSPLGNGVRLQFYSSPPPSPHPPTTKQKKKRKVSPPHLGET